MTTTVNFPKAGMGLEDGTIARWLKAVGDKVRQGEVIVEIENAKALQEVEAPVSGTLIQIMATEGQTVAVNSDLAIIEEEPG